MKNFRDEPEEEDEDDNPILIDGENQHGEYPPKE